MDIFEADDNSTPLTAEEKNGLKLKWITLRSELNEAEARNIAQAQLWLAVTRKRMFVPIHFCETFIKKCFVMSGYGQANTGLLKEILALHHIRFQ